MSHDIPQHTDRFDEEFLPLARTEDLILTQAKGETLVYDARTHHIHHLNSVSVAIWNACDGRRSIGDIERQLRDDHVIPDSGQSVTYGLQLLLEANLLQNRAKQRTAISRRKVSKMIVGGAVPAIISISAPKASASFSVDPDGPSGSQCYSDSHCPPYHFCTWVESMADLPGDCLLA